MSPVSLELTVVIPTYGRSTQLLNLLGELAKQTLATNRFEVIVVDDGSPEPVQLNLDDYPFDLRLLRRRNGGPGSARNHAIPHSRGAWTLYLNDDTVPATDLLEQHIRAQAEAPEKSLILGTFHFTPEALQSAFVQLLQATDLLFAFPSLEEGKRLPWTYCWTCNLSIPTEALREVEGFDAQLFDSAIVEDVELGYRLEQLGYGVHYFASCRALHDHVLEAGGYLERMERLGFYLTRMWAKHGNPRILWCSKDATVQELLSRCLDQAELQSDAVPALVKAMADFEVQAAGRQLDTDTIRQFHSVMREVSMGPWLAGMHRALTGVNVREVSEAGPPRGQLTTIVIVSYNSLQMTQDCLASLRLHHDPDFPTQIVVVDNGSTDGSAEWLAQQSDVELLANSENLGAPAARNQALARGYGDWVCFLDNDIVVTRGWLERALYHMAVDPRVGCVPFVAQRASKDQVMPYSGDGSPQQLEAFTEKHLRDYYRKGKTTDLFASFGVLVRPAVIERIGGFDERFSPWGFEDDDFSLRSILAGFRNRVALDVFVYHAPYVTTDKTQRHRSHLADNWRAFADKWGPAGQPTPELFDYEALQLRLDVKPAEEDLVSPLPQVSPAVPAAALDGPHNLVILGSGRSGTSMVAGTLAEAGWFPGNEPYEGRGCNPKGFFETAEINGINEYLLGRSFPTATPAGHMQRWLLALDAGQEVQSSPFVEGLIAGAVEQGPFVIKDPRLCYTLDQWRPHLQDARFVCVFRDPATTANSMVKEVQTADYLRDVEFRYEEALETWRCMYGRILRQHRKQGQWLFLHYDQLLEESGLNRLESFAGAPIRREFPERRLSRSEGQGVVSAEIAAMYDELCEAAGYRPRQRPLVQEAAAQTPAVQARAEQPRLSVLLCTYNRRAVLERCLASFEQQDVAPGSFELIVVDDGSTDGTAEFLQGYPFRIPHRVLHRENGGLSAARNTGLAHCQGEYVLFINDDTIASPQLVREHLAAHAAEPGELRCIQGSFEQPEEELQKAFMRVLEDSMLVFSFGRMEPGELHDWKSFYTCNVSVPRAAVQQAGGFDESFRHYGAEDTDLALRLHKQGYGVRYVPGAQALHDHPMDFDYLMARNLQTAQAWVRLVVKHPEVLEDEDWSWARRLTLPDIQERLVEALPKMGSLEECARSLGSWRVGAWLRSGSDERGFAVEALQQLEESLLSLNRSWWLEGFRRGMLEFGIHGFDELCPATPMNLATQATHRVLAWPRYDEDDDLEHLLKEFGSALADMESACLCLRHDPDMDGPLEEAVQRLERVYERTLGDSSLEVLFINDPLEDSEAVRLGDAMLATVDLQPRDPARARFLEAAGAPLVPARANLETLLRSA